MEAIYQAQAKFTREFGLQKVLCHRNTKYKRNGTKSYVYLMTRFGFNPTQPGPHFYKTQIKQRGLAHGHVPLGGRIHMHKELVKKVGSDGETGQVTADDIQYDSQYLCPVQIGTPAQTLNLDFDTGSSDLWVFSTELSKSEQGTGHHIFNPAKSTSWKASSSEKWKISYGDGSSASGDVGTDVVSIGGLKITKQCVELAKDLDDSFAKGTGDGLLGLAFSTINTVTTNGRSTPQKTPVENMIAEEAIPSTSELFTSCFYSERDEGKQSFYTFGFIDQDLVQASGQDIAWTNIDSSQGFWMFPSESYSVNGKTASQSGNTAIADTGTTLALVSDEVCTAIYNAIEGAEYNEQAQGWVIPASITADQLPEVQVAVGGNMFTIQKEDLLFAPISDSSDSPIYGAVQSRGSMTFDILGDAFLKSVYCIWDLSKPQIGMVPKIEATQNTQIPDTAGS